jgi:hypothetical protein
MVVEQDYPRSIWDFDAVPDEPLVGTRSVSPGPDLGAAP